MRTLFFVSLFVCLVGSLQAQYVVKKVQGKVYTKNKAIQIKDKINPTDSLRFSSLNDFVSVLFPGKGYYILAPKKEKKNNGEFISALKDAIVPPNEYYAAATRSGDAFESATFEDQYDIKAFFRDELFFIAPAKFKVAAASFPLDSAHFFNIRHHLKNGWINKSLPYADQAFEINEAVLQVNGKTLNISEITYSELYYVNLKSGEEQYLGRFKLQFPAVSTIQGELTTLQEAVGQMPAEQFLREYAVPYLYFQYGKTQRAAIEQLIAAIQQK